MKLLHFIVLVAFLAHHVPLIEGHPIQNSTDPLRPTLPYLLNGSDIWNRLKRDSEDENLKSSVTKLEILARITNAIYLQQSLISGSIPPDAFISELLHFGSIKPSDISSLDLKKIQVALDSVKNFPTEMKVSMNVENAENAILHLDTVVKSVKGLGEITMWNGADVKTEIDELAKNGMTPKVVTKLSDSCSSWKYLHGVLSDDSQLANSKSDFHRLIAPLTTIKSAANDLSSIKSYWTSTKYTSASDMLDLIVQAKKVSVAVGQSMHATKSDVDTYLAYFDSIQTNLTPLKSKPFDVIRNLLTARKMSTNHRTFKHTFGLPGGSSGLSKIHEDLSNPWFREVIDSPSWRKSLDKLIGLTGSFKKIDGVLDSSEMKEQLDPVVVFLDQLDHVISSSDQMKTGLQLTYGCQQPSVSGQSDLIVDQIAAHLAEIDRMVSEIPKQVQDVIKYLNDHKDLASMCDEVIEICKEAETSPNINEVVTKFKDYKNLKDLTKHIGKIGELSMPPKIQDKADAVKALNWTELTIYHDYQKANSDFFKCLQKDELTTVLKIVALVKAIRSPNPTLTASMDSGLTAIKKIADTKTDLKTLETSILAQKGFKSPETDQLALLKDSSKHSMTIGLAVQGVSGMKNVLEKKQDLERLQKVKKVIEKQKNKKSLGPEDVANLDSLLKMIDGIQKMLMSLNTFKGSVKPSMTLLDHSNIFQKAKSVSGVSGNFQKVRTTVAKVIGMMKDPNEKKTLEDVGKILEDLDSLEMDFAKFQKPFDGSKETLEVLDSFFKELVGSAGSQKSEDLSFFTIILAIIGILIIVALITLAVFLLRGPYRYIFNSLWIFGKYDYREIVINYYHTEIEDYSSANKKNWDPEDYTPEFKAFKKFFMASFQYFNTENNMDPKLLFQENSKESLGNEPLVAKTRVRIRGKRFKTDYYPANYVRLPDRRVLIVGQSPLNGAFCKLHEKEATVEKFWIMVWQEKSKDIFMVSAMFYDKRAIVPYEAYFPAVKGEKKKYGDIVIECLEDGMPGKEEEVPRKALYSRKLSVKIGKSISFTVNHHWMPWTPGTVPHVQKDVAVVVKKILSLPKNNRPIIHCGDGLNESGTIVYIAYCINYLEVYKKVDMNKCLLKTRASRTDVIQNPRSYGLCSYVMAEYYVNNPDDIIDPKLRAKYDYLVAGWKDMIAPPPESKEAEKKKTVTKKADEPEEVSIASGREEFFRQKKIWDAKQEKKEQRAALENQRKENRENPVIDEDLNRAYLVLFITECKKQMDQEKTAREKSQHESKKSLKTLATQASETQVTTNELTKTMEAP
ncbi:hypothetical protein B9Z55_003456 [Caenorhabditis nigoni]|uniref:Tyrosine-protein phosphatase domain-containing protein n=1 Tax=Caenorhabditis nigoni TaxID=1611254 RepID=A0A2G5VQW6_9PELO|nr:hypothetical protein B9Z55_003456 [Caenorhabditis nigoni]